MIRFSCPNCNTGLRVPDDFSAPVVNCPKCKTPIKTPREPVARLEPMEAVNVRTDDDVAIPRRKKKKRRSSVSVPIAIWIAFGINVLFRFVDTAAYTANAGNRANVEDFGRPPGYEAFLLGLRWFIAVACWIGIFLRSNGSRQIMVFLCWLSLLGYIVIGVGSAFLPDGPDAVMLIICIVLGILTSVMAVLLSQDESQRFTNG